MTREEYENQVKMWRLACYMDNPIRCGGAHYDKSGNLLMMVGGKLRTQQEVNQLKANQKKRMMAVFFGKMVELAGEYVCQKY